MIIYIFIVKKKKKKKLIKYKSIFIFIYIRCKDEHNLIVNVSNWNIKSLSPDLLSYVYDDIILVSFNRRNQNDFVYDVNLDFINLEKTKYRIDIEKVYIYIFI